MIVNKRVLGIEWKIYPKRRLHRYEDTRHRGCRRSEERRVGKECELLGVDLGGRRIIQAEDGIRDTMSCDWSSDVCSSDLNGISFR